MVANSKTDITQMTDAEIAEYMKARKIQTAKLVAEKGKKAKEELEGYCLKKYGLSLQQIYTSGGEGPKTYKNPHNGETYIYSGRGKVPGWLKIGGDGDDANKPNPHYEVKSN